MDHVATQVFGEMRPRFAAHLMTLYRINNLSCTRVWTYTHNTTASVRSLLRTKTALTRLRNLVVQQMHAIGYTFVHMDVPLLEDGTLLFEMRFSEYEAIERGQKQLEYDALVGVIERMTAAVKALTNRRDMAIVVFGAVPCVAEIFSADVDFVSKRVVPPSFLRALVQVVQTHMPHYRIEYINRERFIFSLQVV